VGFAGSYELARNARTQGSNGATPYETRISAYRAGIRYSIPLSRLLFALGVDHGQHSFALVGGPDQSPNVGYKFVRPSVAFRADGVSALAVGLTVGYSHVTAV
jgi:hypothetical protein